MLWSRAFFGESCNDLFCCYVFAFPPYGDCNLEAEQQSLPCDRMATLRGSDEMYLQEARLERQYLECEQVVGLMCTTKASATLLDPRKVTEASIKALRKLNGFWDR